MSNKLNIINEISNEISKYVIKSIFANLQESQHQFISKCMYGLLYIIVCAIDSDDNESLLAKFRQNNWKFAKWLVIMLIPHVKSSVAHTNGIHHLGKIKNLNEITTLKLLDADITKQSPIYKYSNYQYDHCKYMANSDHIEEIIYDETIFAQNYYLLINTIYQCRYKLHVNWIDVLPIKMNEYKETTLYNNTKNIINQKRIVDTDIVSLCNIESFDNSAYEQLSSLNVDDIYDVISIDIYDNAISTAWLLDDIEIKINDQYTPATTLHGLRIVLYDIVFHSANEIHFERLEPCQKNGVIDVWDAFLMVYDTRQNFFRNGLSINRSDMFNDNTNDNDIIVGIQYEWLHNILMSLVKSYEYENGKNDTSYIKLNKIVSQQSLLKSARSINIKYLYEMICNIITKFKRTWFSLNMMTPDKCDVLFTQNSYIFAHETGINISYKCVYDFCRQLVTTNITPKKNRVRYAKYWSSLSKSSRQELLCRLNNTGNIISPYLDSNSQYCLEWLSLANYIKFIKKSNAPSFTNNEITTIIYGCIMDKLVDIIFENLIMRGVLSTITIKNIALTDTDTINKQQVIEQLKQTSFTDEYNSHAYYYLTCLPYKFTGVHKIKKNPNEDTYYDMNYFDILTYPKWMWYGKIMYEIGAQLNFCNKFINNRVNFVTAATGEGKSSQIPKLLCYYMVAINHKLNPSVVVSVPRINQVNGLCSFVPVEMGVPIFGEDNNKHKNKYDNYYVQYMHTKDSHTKNGDHPKITYMTDGTLLQIARNSFLKKIIKHFISNPHSDRVKATIYQPYHDAYTVNNIYDAYVIDEAHEHNVNIDMLLTILRYSVHMNNQIQLVIMSATIDDDEPNYRRYYRMINDNRKYPLNQMIALHRIDRNAVDRRIHVENPNAHITYKIEENIVFNVTLENLAKEIITNNTTGNILIFHAGAGDVKECVKILNAPGFLPANVIALPFFAKMRESITNHNADFIEKIDSQLNDLRISKSDDFEKVNYNEGNNRYDRFILVATNIMEAGITIESLKYVIDTGIEKKMFFNYATKKHQLNTHLITFESRLQRRGRVGRVGNGAVYYLYDINKTLNQKKRSNITNDDIRFSIVLPFLKSQENNKLTINIIDEITTGFTTNTNFAHLDILSEIVALFVQNITNCDAGISHKTAEYLLSKSSDKNIEMPSIVIDKSNQIISIAKLFSDMYTYDIHNTFYAYYGNEDIFYYDKSIKIHDKIYSNCEFAENELVDANGTFYINHPDDISFERNIIGKIVKCIPKKCSFGSDKFYMSNKVATIWDMLSRDGFIKYDSVECTHIKTSLGMFIDDIALEVSSYDSSLSNRNIVNALCMYICFNLEHFANENWSKNIDIDINIRLIALLCATFGEVTKLIIDDDNYNQNYNLAQNTFNTTNGDDIDVYMNIIKLFDKIREENSIDKSYFDNDMNKTLWKNERGKFRFENEISSYKQKMKQLIRDYAINKCGKFGTICDINSKGVSRTKISLMIHNGIKFHDDTIQQYIYIYDVIKLAINDYITNQFAPYKFNDIPKLFKELSNETASIRHMANELNVNPTKAMILLSHRYNVCRRMTVGNNQFMSIYKPGPDCIYYVQKKSTFVSETHLSRYIVYLTQSSRNSIKTIMFIDKKQLKLIAKSFDVPSLYKPISRKKNISKYVPALNTLKPNQYANQMTGLIAWHDTANIIMNELQDCVKKNEN